MCDRPNGGAVSITPQSTVQTIAGGGTYQLKQRANRVRVIFSINAAGTIVIYHGAVQNDRVIAAVSNPGLPFVMDFAHYGIIVANDLWVKNVTGGNLDVPISEWLQGF
jgi:hypothetical protein